MSVVMAVVIVAATGLVGAGILVLASRFFAVEVDERVTQVQEALPGANCGACGYAGCADYAAAVVEEDAAPNLCIPGGAEVARKVAAILGVNAGPVAQRKAVVACEGSAGHAADKYDYAGIPTCTANAKLHGGSSSCPYGCLGYGDCAAVCEFDAIVLQDGLARVIPEKCTGCGACEAACPKRVIWIREVSEKPVVMCASHQSAAETHKACSVGCIACMKCEKACPTGAIKVIDNVARIDLERCDACMKCVDVCPVKAIVIPQLV